SGPPACAISIALVFTFTPLLDHQFPVRLFRKLPLKAIADCPGRLSYPPERNNMSNLSTSSALEDERNFDAEFEYTYNFFPFLKADSLRLATLLQGVRPSSEIVTATGAPGPLAYCELGCGQGLTLNIL